MSQDAVQDIFNLYWPYIVAGFSALMIWAVINTQQKWDRIAGPFRTRIKVKEDDFSTVHIDGRVFRKVIIVPIEEGLYLAQFPLLARIFIPKRVLIPWRNLSDIQMKPRTALGFTVNEYFVDVSSGQKVELKIPKSVAEEIVNRNFLKQV